MKTQIEQIQNEIYFLNKWITEISELKNKSEIEKLLKICETQSDIITNLIKETFTTDSNHYKYEE